MASKKITLLTALFALITICSQAQLPTNKDWGWNWKDSSKVPTVRIPQYNAFIHNQFPYPAKPRDQFEIGLDFGYANMFSDLDTRYGDFGGHEAISFGGGIHVRKSLSPTWSVRLAYSGSYTYGQDWRPRFSVQNIPLAGFVNVWQRAYVNNGLTYFANFRNKMHTVSLDFIYSLNTLDFFRANPKWNLYVFGGYAPSLSDVDVDALDASGNPYLWTVNNAPLTIAQQAYATAHPGSVWHNINIGNSREDIRSQLNAVMDHKYESNAPSDNGSRQNVTLINKNWLLRHGFDFGGGFSYKLNDTWNLGLEQKFIYSSEDQWDGVREGNNNDMLAMTTIHINRNIGSTAKKVQPLWWINPYNYIYNELNVPSHIKIPTPKLPDADGDGITDQFDLEPNTPAGAAVDSRGRALDSDGDGVPDYKDKELLTPQKCFPVNSDGIGVCPDAACCAKIDALQSEIDSLKKNGIKGAGAENFENLPSIQFKNGAKISKEAANLLEAIAAKMKANPNYKVKVIGHPLANKVSQQKTWERVNATIKYLSEKLGISENRFIFTYDGGTGDPNTVDLQYTTDEGPNTVPAPFPNLKNKN